MGDRANVAIRGAWTKDAHEKEAVFLYGHWSGYDLPETVRKALAMRERWSDESHLARIIFEAMLGDSRGGTTGFGISTRITDNEYDIIVLLPGTQALARISEDLYRAVGFAALADAPTISFEDYIAVDERTWDNLTEAHSVAP